MPDRDGTTLKEVINRSLEIDPVNVYVINTTTTAPFYASLTELTNGEIFTDTSGTSSDYVLDRPVVNFPLANYMGLAGEELEISAITTDNIISYEWDLDFDGVFETTTNTPQILAKYTAKTSGFIQLKVTDSSGKSSTASARVSIYDEFSLPEISEVSYVTLDSSAARLDFTTKNAIATLVSINGAILGVTTENSLEITDINGPVSVILTPIGTDGFTGAPISTNITASASITSVPFGKGKANRDAENSATPSSRDDVTPPSENDVASPTTAQTAVKTTILAPIAGKH